MVTPLCEAERRRGQALREVCSLRWHWCQHNKTQNYSGVAEGQKESNEKAGDELARIKKQTSSGRYSIKTKPRRSLILQGLRKSYLNFI
jgi:hypothetical protein